MTVPLDVPGNYHARYDPAVGVAAGRAGQVGRKEAGVRRLAAAVPGLDVSYDDSTGLPVQLTTASGARLGSDAATAVEAATRFVDEHADVWDLTSPDVGTVEIRSVSTRGLRVVRLGQRVDGVEVFGSDVTLGLDARHGIVASRGQLFRGARSYTDGRSRDRVDPDVAARVAVARATADLTGTPADPDEFVRDRLHDRGHYRAVQGPDPPPEPRPAMSRPSRTKAVLFPLGDGLFRQGCYVELWLGELPAFSYVIDVDAPYDVLFRNCLTADAHFTYVVHNTGDRLLRPMDSPAPGTPHPDGTPNGFQAPTVAERAVTVDSLIGDDWLDSRAVITAGNNCVTVPQAVVSSVGEFAWNYDHGAPATATDNVQNGLVAMFFAVNWAHDRWYAAGFDEAAGNAQYDNLGRGGDDGDVLVAQALYFGTTNNARMYTPADGDSPLLTAYVFDGTALDRMSSNETMTVLHELGHYLSNRLVGNAGGLSNPQGWCMGEGWGDFLALCMTSQPGDDFADGCFSSTGWSALLVDPGFRENYYYGLRRYPYSSRTDRNPLSFRHISKGEDLPATPSVSPRWLEEKIHNHEPHMAGEVWCSALWDAFVNLVERHGHLHAERRMLHYVIGGLGLTPDQPTFVQARQAVVAAVTAIDPADLRPVWTGFAKRGLGFFAFAPAADSFNLKDVVESYVVPFGLPDDTKISVLCAMNQLL